MTTVQQATDTATAAPQAHVAEVRALDKDANRWHVTVHHAETLEVAAEGDVERTPEFFGADELSAGFVDAAVQRLGFHRCGDAGRSRDDRGDIDAVRPGYAFEAFRIPEHPRPAWADERETPAGVLEYDVEDGTLVLEYEHRVGTVRGVAEQDVLDVYLTREDRVERGVLVEGPLRIMVGTDGGDVFFTGAQAERAAALIEDAAMLERRIAGASTGVE